MIRRGRLLLLAALGFGGCSSLDPTNDYRRAASQIQTATGREPDIPVERAADLAGRVDELLRGGLTVDEAVEMALLNNQQLQADWLRIGVSRADLVQSSLLRNPSIGGTLRFPGGGGLANLEFAIAQNIADLWLIPYRREAAQRELDRTILDIARVAATVVNDTRAAYYRAVGARRLHAISQENFETARRLSDLTAEKQRIGDARQYDVNLARTATIDAELGVESARLLADEARRLLARQLGLMVDADQIELTSNLPSIPVEGFSLDSLIQNALDRRLDVQAAQQEVARAEREWQLERSSVFSEVAVGLSLEREAQQKQPGRDTLADTARTSIANGGLTAPEIQPRSERRHNTSIVIGPSFDLELPLFDQNQAQIRRAMLEYNQAQRLLEHLRRSAVQDVRSAADQLMTAARISRFYEQQTIPLASRNLELSRQAYQFGDASLLSVIEAQRFLLDARRKAVEAVQNLGTALPQLEQAVGLPAAKLLEFVGPDQPDSAATTSPETESLP